MVVCGRSDLASVGLFVAVLPLLYPLAMTAHGRRVIVVGYDGSEPSRAALKVAAQRAASDGVVYIVHAYDLPPDFLGYPNFDRLLSERKKHGRAILEAAAAEESAGPGYVLELVGGPPAEAIAGVASARHADEIVVGARGHGRVRALLGSTSHELLHIADRPVLVIPAAAVERLRSAETSG